MIAGGGVLYSEAEDELVELARANGIPVAETFAGKGAVQASDWFQLGGLGVEGNPAATRVALDADVVVAVGTRLTDFATGSNSLFQHPDVRFVAINVWGRDAAKQGALPVIADAREALGALRAALRRLVDGRGVPRRGHAGRVPSGSSSGRRSTNRSTARR